MSYKTVFRPFINWGVHTGSIGCSPQRLFIWNAFKNIMLFLSYIAVRKGPDWPRMSREPYYSCWRSSRWDLLPFQESCPVSLCLHRSYRSLRSGRVCVCVFVILRGCRSQVGVFKQFSKFQSYQQNIISQYEQFMSW